MPEIVETNQRYCTATIEFRVLDIVSDELPSCDCILVRDCFSHLRFFEIESALDNLCQSGSRYLLVTHYIDQLENEDIKTGDFHRLNFTLSPFGFPPAEDILIENHPNPRHADKALALWDLNVVRRALKTKGERCVS